MAGKAGGLHPQEGALVRAPHCVTGPQDASLHGRETKALRRPSPSAGPARTAPPPPAELSLATEKDPPCSRCVREQTGAGPRGLCPAGSAFKDRARSPQGMQAGNPVCPKT